MRAKLISVLGTLSVSLLLAGPAAADKRLIPLSQVALNMVWRPE